ncbi:S8 family serine peptidase [Veronia pacifica]|uniref:P/Homo B domain-containing protein n=1 Tax=Veronia pacifica TaxID=1080227 RepID=A0A1C3ERP3_9GAMM|nr:S8 family serine peptidase [Veronia pacifica]ODA35891.1 hypothetical protein A8L45_02325 [Veronia pacifica]
MADNIVPGASRDLANNDNDPSPEGTSGDHGTSVAGLIAAKGFNGIGGRGVAPDAGLSGFNYLNAQTFKAFIASHGGNETKDADVINQSYGFGLPLLLPSTFFAAELAYTENYYKNNPNPFLQIKSAGNGFNELSLGLKYFSRAEQTEGESKLPHQLSNADPFNATFYNTVVSATSADENNPRSSYSTTGSSVMFAAFGGEYGVNNPAMITTDVQGCDRGYSKSYQGNYSGGLNQDIQERTDCSYTSQFNGTSSAAPVASGVAALVMEANPDLTWRDVRYIMAKTAKKIDQDFESGILYQNGQFYVAEPGWVTNAAGNTFHNWYGYGLLDATKAVQMATRGYSLLPALAETSFIEAEGLPADIPEDFNGLERTIEVSEDMLVEAVQLRVTLDHQRLNDLALEVISPSGTRSVVATPRNIHFKHISELTNSDTKAPLEALLFLSNAFLDEKAQGTWRIRAIDTNNEEVKISEWNASNNSTTTLTLPNNDSLGSLAKAELRIYGH